MNPCPNPAWVTAALWSHRVARSLTLAALVGGAGAWPSGLSAQNPRPDSLPTVVGRVLEHETERPLAGAAVSLASGPGGTRGIGTRVTNDDGRFLFRRVPPGTYRILVTLLGYRDLQDTLQVTLGSDLDMVLPLSVSPIELEPLVVVTERRDWGIMGDFEARRRRGFGTFFDREYIESRNPGRFTDLLRMVPGVRVLPRGQFDYSVRMRGGCTPDVWVDGVRLVTPEGLDQILHTMDVEAVEVYHSSTLPVQFGSNNCGGILVWTRRGEAIEGGGSFWKRVGIAGALAMLAFLLSR